MNIRILLNLKIYKKKKQILEKNLEDLQKVKQYY